MGRLLAIDYGKKRTGIAVTDTLQIIANGLCTVETSKLFDFLSDYLSKESVEKTNGEDSENMKRITPFVNRLRKLYPTLPITFYDERFTTVLAHQAILESGIGKKARRENKGLVDQISATIILEDYMASNKNATDLI